ncbi:uncharacterized protein LOC110027923 isoform X3 [Phalaenopsis equestris]|uniref:uncharacterized protein LOC110027923 isoform X3 n=1 Tax=Phalaenopsis equestris TaxID=78828 RepID=UPI0009E4501C|nr:uncharacterized protein LOC110027923 isoform X3 [Phalaenopsis equestris]
MSRSSHQGYSWAVAAGINAALAAVSAKLFSSLLLKYGLVLFFNATMWGCYINSLKVLSSLQATVTNFATNFISSGLAGFFLFQEPLPSRVHFLSSSAFSFSASQILRRSQAKIEDNGVIELGVSCSSSFARFQDI